MAGAQPMPSDGEEVVDDPLDGDAAVCEEVLDLAEPEAEPIVEPDGVADDDGREPIARIANRVVGHPVTVPAVGSS